MSQIASPPQAIIAVVNEHPTPVMHQLPVAPGQGIGQHLRQPRPIRQHPRRRRADVRHQDHTVRGDPQVPRRRRKLTPKVPLPRET
jgi:hypothetical protein